MGMPPARLQDKYCTFRTSRRMSDLRTAKLLTTPNSHETRQRILQTNWHILTRAQINHGNHFTMGNYQSCRCFRSLCWLNGNLSNFLIQPVCLTFRDTFDWLSAVPTPKKAKRPRTMLVAHRETVETLCLAAATAVPAAPHLATRLSHAGPSSKRVLS